MAHSRPSVFVGSSPATLLKYEPCRYDVRRLEPSLTAPQPLGIGTAATDRLTKIGELYKGDEYEREVAEDGLDSGSA